VSRDSAKASPSALAEHQRMIQWQNDTIVDIPLDFLDKTTKSPIKLADNVAAKTELYARCDAFADQYIKLSK
jgi:Ulp1 family protease